MMLLVSGGTKTWIPIIRADPHIFGVLAVPKAGNHLSRSLYEGVRWAADNGAFSGFDEDAFYAMLRRHNWARDRCLWVAAPDVVGNAAETLKLFAVWEPRIRRCGYKVALVAQDGLEAVDVPWNRVDTLFLGGSTEWKLGSEAAFLTVVAHYQKKLVHMGRVNSSKRIRYAASLGVDSIDGSGWSRFPLAMLKAHGATLRQFAKTREAL